MIWLNQNYFNRFNQILLHSTKNIGSLNKMVLIDENFYLDAVKPPLI